MQKVVTLKDVASVAGVSLATASRVINGHAGVSAQNRAKVEEAIRKLNYSPNAIARSLATGRTGTISLIIVQEDPIVPTTWSHELPIIQAIHDTVKTQNWELQITMCSYREFRQPSFLPHHLSRGTVDGVVDLSAWLVERHVVARAEGQRLPFVIIEPMILITRRSALNLTTQRLSAAWSSTCGAKGMRPLPSSVEPRTSCTWRPACRDLSLRCKTAVCPSGTS